MNEDPVNSLEEVFISLITEMLRNGREPEHLIRIILGHAIGICTGEVPMLVKEKIGYISAGRSEINRWERESATWEQAFQHDEVDREQFRHEDNEHEERMSRIQRGHDKIDERAGQIFTSAVSAQRILTNIKELSPPIITQDSAIDLAYEIGLSCFSEYEYRNSGRSVEEYKQLVFYFAGLRQFSNVEKIKVKDQADVYAKLCPSNEESSFFDDDTPF